MKIDRSYEIERIASKDETRPHLFNCYLEAEDGKLVATDGHAMAVVPVTGLEESPGPCPKDVTGFVAPAAIKAARKLAKRNDPAVLGANGKHVLTDGTTMPRPEAGHFPPYKQVIPEYRPGAAGTITIGLNARLLVELAKAIGKDDDGRAVVGLTFPVPQKAGEAYGEMLDPYVIEGLDGALGVLMPARV